ncbi:MAG: hypothetical protein MRJ96_12045 [Nitrospirales bacterium]|nr:hypothetical protein [Nitrospira sp.]MDR4502172.1 hypothetical protein [Nitrospirales bacterium]
MKPAYVLSGLLAGLVCFFLLYVVILPYAADSLPFHSPISQLGTHKEYSRYEEPPDRPLKLIFADEPSRLYVSRADGVIEEWDTQHRAQTKAFETNSIFSYIASRHSLITKTLGDNVEILDLTSQKITPLARDFYIHSVVDPTGAFLLLSTGGKSLEMWSLEKNQLSQRWESYDAVRNGVAIAFGGEYVAAAEGTYDSLANFHHTTIQLWERGNALPRFLFNGEHEQEVHGVWSILFSPDSSLLAVDSQVDRQAGVTVWETSTGKLVFTIRDLKASWVRALAFSPDGDHLALGDELGNLMIWNLDFQKKVWQTQVPGQAIHSIAFSPDGQSLAAGVQDSTVQIWGIELPSIVR